jgi:dihydropteroate synthase
MIQGSRLKPSGLPGYLNDKNHCLVIGVLNITPDSFSDGGLFNDEKSAIDHAKKLIEQGADVIDVGGESTRPGATRIEITEEQKRVIPVIEELTKLAIPVSIDTMRSETAKAAVQAGAIFINDISGGLADEKMHEVVASLNVPYVLMHWRGHSTEMDDLAKYENVTKDVISELQTQVTKAIKAGIKKELIVIDPGLGFAKNPEQNWQILREIKMLKELSLPLYVGASRKRFLTDYAIPAGSSKAQDRDFATAVISTYSALNGAWAVRVHDVAASVQAVKLSKQLMEFS